MAEIPVQKKGGIPWWVWLLLAALAIVLLIWWMTDDDDDARTPAADPYAPAVTETQPGVTDTATTNTAEIEVDRAIVNETQ